MNRSGFYLRQKQIGVNRGRSIACRDGWNGDWKRKRKNIFQVGTYWYTSPRIPFSNIREGKSSALSSLSSCFQVQSSNLQLLTSSNIQQGHVIGSPEKRCYCNFEQMHFNRSVSGTCRYDSISTIKNRNVAPANSYVGGNLIGVRRHSSTDRSTTSKRNNAAYIKTEPDMQQLGELDQQIDRRTVFQYLKLKTFDNNEMSDVFEAICSSTSQSKDHDDALLVVTEDNLTEYILQRIKEIDSKQQQQQHQQLQHGDKMNSEAAVEEKESKDHQMREYANMEAKRIIALLNENNDNSNAFGSITATTALLPNQQTSLSMDKQTFLNQLRDLASKIDTTHTIPISISMLLVGSSVGIVIPMMPFVVSNLGLSAGQYGTVVSSFALAKLIANVPAAVMVERHGRKPYLVYSLVVISLGVGGIGLATQFEHLVLCRIFTGIGVSALSTAATLAIADCSTPLNRASTMAPMMSSFAAGTALGPVIGGVLADRMGIQSTFYLVGCIYLSLTALNQMVLSETKVKNEHQKKFPWNNEQSNRDQKQLIKGTEEENGNRDDGSLLNSLADAMSQWSPLLKIENVRNVVVINGFYWAALSGSQMTLLPLILTNPEGLAFTATQVGEVYMGMSLVQVLGNPTMASLIDRLGKVNGIVAGCTFLSTAMFTLPYCTEMNEVIATCGLWALGSTMLSTAPVSFISDNVSDCKRAQAIALFRTVGDVGFLLGAMSAGAFADVFDMDAALHASAGMLLSATGWFTTRSLLERRRIKH